MPNPNPPDHSSVLSFADRDFNAISDQQARRLLKLGMTRGHRPVDALIDRLQATDSAAWWAAVLNGEPFGTLCGPGANRLHAGQLTLEQLAALKEAGKSQARDPDRNKRLIARAAYDLAIAAALVHHNRIITTQKRGELLDVLTDLAEVAPAPWHLFLQQAADKVPSVQERPGTAHGPA